MGHRGGDGFPALHGQLAALDDIGAAGLMLAGAIDVKRQRAEELLDDADCGERGLIDALLVSGRWTPLSGRWTPQKPEASL
jgi:hypothetical protein